jgi:hypothetical protein
VLTPVSVSRCIAQNVYVMLFSFSMLQAISTYLFEQHAGSSKKHPADHIYLANGNSLRDVIRASGSSPLESLYKTIQSSIDPMGIRSRASCLNCNGETFVLRLCLELLFSLVLLSFLMSSPNAAGHLPSSQTEHFLCHCCLESKQPQDPTSPYACGKSNSG